MFAGHIVIGIFADDDSPLLGLRNLVMPLRCTPICFLIMCNYFNGTWYNHKTWFYKTTLDCSKLTTYTFMGWHTFSFLLTNHVLCVLVSSITSTTIIAAVVYILTQGFKHPIRWPTPHHYCGKHDLPCAGVGLAQVVWTSYAKIIWTFHYWRTCSETCPRSRLWTETHWTELTSGQWRYFAK